MKLSRNGASADHGTYEFEDKRLTANVRLHPGGPQLNLLFRGSLHEGSRHNYCAALTLDEAAMIIKTLSESLDSISGDAVRAALSGSTRDLFRLVQASAQTTPEK